MTATTILEKNIVLKLFKNFTVDYNPSNIAEELDKTRVGTFKALKELEHEVIVNGKKFGKATFYKLNLDDDYARKNVELLLIEESKKYQRWIDEFKELFEFVDICILFGSIVKNGKNANDIDLLLVLKGTNNWRVEGIIKEKNQMLTKKIHQVKQTKQDLINNIKKGDKVVLQAIKEGIVLYGFEELIDIVKDVTS